jgi:hypothetical protein
VTKSLLPVALDYLDRGWSVIPIRIEDGVKKALVKWKPFQTRRAEPEEVQRWWKEFPDALVGIVTGEISNLVVVDIDPKHGGDADTWAKRQPSGLRANTRSGGAHFYYSYPEGGRVRNSAGRIAKGIDVRAEGGYVVAPPSSGYSWASRGKAPVYRDEAPREEVRAERTDSGEQWLARLLKGVGEGERDDACSRLAGYYLKKKVPQDVVIQTLLNWNQLNDPPLSEADIYKTVESVARTAGSRIRVIDNGNRSDTNDDGNAYPIVGFTDYMARHGGHSTDWLIKDWLPLQTVGLVVSPPATFKTWLLQDLAVSVSTGLPFLGQFPVERPGDVLFMQQEDYHGQIASRFGLIASRRANIPLPKMVGDRLSFTVPPRIPIHLHEHRSFRFDDSDVVDAWIQQIERIKPRLVILDPLYSAGSVQDFMAGTAREMFLFKSIRDAFGTTFLIAHHTRKSVREPGSPGQPNQVNAAPSPEREDTWGSQFLNAWLETGWQLRKRDELGSASILRHFKAAQNAQTSKITFHIDTTKNPGSYDVTVQEVDPGRKEAAIDITGLLAKHGKLSIGQLVEMTGQHRTTIHRRITQLLRAAVVAKDGNGYVIKE